MTEDWETVGVFDSAWEGKCFFVEKEKGGKKKNGSRGNVGGRDAGLLYCAALHWSMFIHDSALFTRLADATPGFTQATTPPVNPVSRVVVLQTGAGLEPDP